MTGTYTNPIYPRNFPDPFVLRFNGRYYAFATGEAGDGRMFPMLSSKNLVDWEFHGGAMEPLGVPHLSEYWAPEVAYHEGRFYLYYAVGQAEDPDHHLRVAMADAPLGPYADAGVDLAPNEIFAIDAHPYRDPADGQWYLFYARDELDPPFAGTGLVVDRLLSMDRLEGTPRPVLRPYAEWQVFELRRPVKRGLDWYTAEGPFVLRHDGEYICFYSGGRWENPNYGVAYARAPHPLGPWEDDANSGGPVVLTTIAGEVIGPGHNSVVVGPDLLTQHIVYHGWDPGLTGRYPRIDRLQWAEGRPHVEGPTFQPVPAPPLPDFADWFDEADPGPHWGSPGTALSLATSRTSQVTDAPSLATSHKPQVTGGWETSWRRDDHGLRAENDAARLLLQAPAENFVLEIGVRAESGDPGRVLEISGCAIAITQGLLCAGEQGVPLPAGCRHDVWHQLSVRRQAGHVTANIDGLSTVTAPAVASHSVTLEGRPGVSFSHFALTRI